MLRVVIVLLVLLIPSVAQAEKRLALLIGNESYSAEIGRLSNPHNDVAQLEKALKGLGFEVAIEQNASLGALTRAVNAYARRLQAAGTNAVGFFYYSGHGASDGTTNYLIPVDVKTIESGELWDESLRLTEVTRKLKAEAGNATHFVVFDACRNTLKLTRPGSRAIVQSKGFVPVAQENGMLIAYATAEGELASDVGSGAGPYAKALAEEIVRPGVEAVTMFRRVQVRVRSAIGQEPWLGFSALGEVHLAGVQVEPVKPTPAIASPSPGRLSEAAEAWGATKDTTNIAMLEAFIARYKDTFFAELARARVDEINKQQMAVVATSKVPARCDGVEITVGQNERRCLRPGAGKTEQFKDCPTCPEMVLVPAGNFTMGSPANELERSIDEAQVQVSISAPIAVGRFAVTFEEWDACGADRGCNGYKPSDQGWGRGKNPVINVNWDDAKAYAAWISGKTGKTYRLLSEAEREFMARAGTTTAFWWGFSITPKQANYDGSAEPYKGGGSKGEYRKRTVPVDSFAPNPWGLYNVHGNVWEWTEDCWDASKSGDLGDGRARTTGDCAKRVVRGGSWSYNPHSLRSAYRGWNYAGDRNLNLGFRLARTLAP
jgi:formylglycine-generating enzyme required for sulfatase activity